jgi:hypothetical protein
MRSFILLLALSSVMGFAQNRELTFSGEITLGQEFRHEIGSGLILLLSPTDAGWNIGVVPKAHCNDEHENWALLNPPFRGRNMTYLEPSHGVTAAESAKGQYEVWFVRTCADYKLEDARLRIVLWPYTYTQREADEASAKLGTSPMGKVKLTILKSKVSPSGQSVQGMDYGKIDWLSFRVTVTPLVKKGDGRRR